MTAVIQSRPIRIRIGGDLQDWSSRRAGLSLKWDKLGKTGLIKMTGQLTLIAGDTYPAPPESTNPANNISRWHRGQVIYIDYTNDSGVLTPHPMANPAYILEIPARPYFGDNPPLLTLQIGCILALRDFATQDNDQTGVVAGNSTTAQSIVTSLLNAAGITSVSLSAITGSYTAPPIKQNRSSYVVQAGQIAYAAGCYLYQNPSGAVEAVAIDLAPSAPAFSRQVGSNEVLYQPFEDRSEPLAEEVTVTGVRVEGTAPPSGTESPYFDETIFSEGEMGDILPDAANPAARVDIRSVRTRKFAYSSEANREQDLVNESLARGLVDVADSSPLTLFESRIASTIRIYDPSERKISDVTTITALKGLINPDEPSATKFESTTESIATTTIVFGDGTGELVTKSDEIRSRRFTFQQCKIITNPLEDANPYELTTVIDNQEQWANQTDTDRYSYNAYKRQAAILSDSTELENPYALQLVPQFDARADTTNPPPAAEYRTADSSIDETQIEATAVFDFSSGFELKRVHVLPYLQSQATAQTIARMLGQLAAARWLAWMGHFALTDDVMGNLKPLMRSDWTEPDLDVIGYVIDGLSLEYDQTSQIGAAILLPVNPGTYTNVVRFACNGVGGARAVAEHPATYRFTCNGTGGARARYIEPTVYSFTCNQTGGARAVAIPS